MPAPGYDFRPSSHSAVVERSSTGWGCETLTVYGYAWGGPIGLGLAGRRPELIRALVIGNTWAWPDDRLKVRLFSALMGGPLSPLLVERLNLMLRLYLPMNLKRRAADRPGTGRLRRSVAARSDGPSCRSCPARSSPAGAYFREVEAGAPDAGRQAGADPLARFGPGLRQGRARPLAGAAPDAQDGRLERAGQFVDEDAPDDVSAAISAWWDEVVEPGGGAA